VDHERRPKNPDRQGGGGEWVSHRGSRETGTDTLVGGYVNQREEGRAILEKEGGNSQNSTKSCHVAGAGAEAAKEWPEEG